MKSSETQEVINEITKDHQQRSIYKDALIAWSKDNSRIIEYQNNGEDPFYFENSLYEFHQKQVVVPKVLIETFIFIPNDPNPVLLDEELGLSITQATNLRMFPFVKVLAAGEQNKDLVGGIFTVSSDKNGLALNPEYVNFIKQIEEKPSLRDEYPMPPQWVSKMATWSNYGYMINKFKKSSTIIDKHTFLLPLSNLEGKVDVDNIKID